MPTPNMSNQRAVESPGQGKAEPGYPWARSPDVETPLPPQLLESCAGLLRSAPRQRGSSGSLSPYCDTNEISSILISSYKPSAVH